MSLQAFLPLAPANPVLSFVVAVPILLVFYIIFNVARQKIVPRDPSLPPLVFHIVPIIGSTISYGMNPRDFFESCQRKYGNIFTFILFGRPITVALGPHGTTLILNGKLNQVNAEIEYTNLTTPTFGEGVAYDVPNHVLIEQKRFMKNGLTSEKFKHYVSVIVNEVQMMLKNDIFGSSDKGEFEPGKIAAELTICTATASLQGSEVRAAMDKTFADLLHDLDCGFTPLHHVFPGLPLPSYWKRDRAQKKMTQFYLNIMEERRKTNEEHTDMIASLQGGTYKDGREVTDKEIAHMMIALLMAGQHTSAATTSWGIAEIGARPELLKKLYEEQKEIGMRSDGTWEPLTLDQVRSSTLLQATVKEVLRMHPPIHSIMRRVVSDIPVPTSLSRNGETYVIPKGHTVLASPLMSAFNEEVWDKPEAFDPSRFLNQTEEEGEKFDYGFGVISTGAGSPYLPFGAGRHRCIGEQFAHIQIGTIFAVLARETEWTINKVPKPDYSLLVGPIKDSTVYMTRRK